MDFDCNVNPDPRVADWPLMGSPVPLAIILGIYLFAVYIAGPMYVFFVLNSFQR